MASAARKKTKAITSRRVQEGSPIKKPRPFEECRRTVEKLTFIDHNTGRPRPCIERWDYDLISAEDALAHGALDAELADRELEPNTPPMKPVGRGLWVRWRTRKDLCLECYKPIVGTPDEAVGYCSTCAERLERESEGWDGEY